MAKKGKGLPDLDRFLAGKERHLVSYLEGSQLYDLAYTTFVNLAKEAGANMKIQKAVIVDIGIIEDYLDKNPDVAERISALRGV